MSDTDELPSTDAEDWIAERLVQHGCDLYAGQFASMRDRIRATVVANGISRVIVGRHNGRLENYAQIFERLYGEPLEPPSRRSNVLDPRGTSQKG